MRRLQGFTKTAKEDFTMPKIAYVCEPCWENCSEASCHERRDDIRVTPSGVWMCDCCYENDPDQDPDKEPAIWADLPLPPKYVPLLPRLPIIIHMLKTVTPDFQFGVKEGTSLIEHGIYGATSNPVGAVCGICDNGELLGVKPGEFQFVEAPQWLRAIHEKFSS